jgi:hypothetical protein
LDEPSSKKAVKKSNVPSSAIPVLKPIPAPVGLEVTQQVHRVKAASVFHRGTCVTTLSTVRRRPTRPTPSHPHLGSAEFVAGCGPRAEGEVVRLTEKPFEVPEPLFS